MFLLYGTRKNLFGVVLLRPSTTSFLESLINWAVASAGVKWFLPMIEAIVSATGGEEKLEKIFQSIQYFVLYTAVKKIN